MLLPGVLLLGTAALALRTAAGALRATPARLPLRLTGWALTGVAAWFAAGAAGAWAPLWPALLAALLAGAVLAPLERRLARRRAQRLTLWVGADALLVVGLGLLSIPALAPIRLAATALLLAAAGLGLDLTLGRLPAAPRRAVNWAAVPAMAGVLAFLAFALLPPGGERRPDDLSEAVALSSGVTPAVLPGERRITLETGAAAWLDQLRGAGALPGALFFHGAHPGGSHQPAALAVRRALLDAGFAVLAVDHPGYGESPHPDLNAEVTAWDPLPTALAAYEALSAVPGVRGITAVGHSMGNGDVLRLLGAGVPLAAAVMLGASLSSPEDAAYWDERFLRDRRIAAPMDPERVQEIRERYYESRRYIAEVPTVHPPVQFITFGIEWPNIVATRDEFYALLPGPKVVWHLAGATHYLSAEGVRRAGLVVGDSRATRDLAAGLRAGRGGGNGDDGGRVRPEADGADAVAPAVAQRSTR